MSIILHIGYGKTGTTSIQNYCWNNREALYNSGILYPNLGILGTGHHSITPLGSTQLSKNSIEILEAIKEESLKSEKKILISSENIIFYHKDVIREIADLFRDIDVTIICYVRQQHKLIESTFLEWQKVGADYCNGDIFKFFNTHKNSFNFNSRIAPWENAFVNKKIIARLYHRDIIGEDVVSDFLKLLEIPIQKQSSLIEKSNLSIIPELSNIVTIYDQQTHSPSQRKNFIDEILLLSNLFRSYSSFSLINPYLDTISQHYADSNLIFANKYLSFNEKSILLS